MVVNEMFASCMKFSGPRQNFTKQKKCIVSLALIQTDLPSCTRLNVTTGLLRYRERITREQPQDSLLRNQNSFSRSTDVLPLIDKEIKFYRQKYVYTVY